VCSRRCSHATGVGDGSRGLICCAMFLSMPPSLSCVWKMRRRRSVSGRAYVVLLTELLGERGAHDSAADTGRGREVRLARLSSGRRQSCGGRGSVLESIVACIAARTGVDLGHLVGIELSVERFKSRWSSQIKQD
jgi:hypothetical protein